MLVNKIGIYNQAISNKKDTNAKNPSFGMALKKFDVVDEVILKNPDTTKTIHNLAKDCQKVANRWFGVKSLTNTNIAVDGNKVVAEINVSKRGIAKINAAKPSIVEPFDADNFTTRVEGDYNSQTGYNRFIKRLKTDTKSITNAVKKQVKSFEAHKQQIDDLKNGAFITKDPAPKARKTKEPTE